MATKCPICRAPWTRDDYEPHVEELNASVVPADIKRPGRPIVECAQGHRFVLRELVMRVNHPRDYRGLTPADVT